MCTPNQGQVIINLYKKLGYDVISDRVQGVIVFFLIKNTELLLYLNQFTVIF